MKIIIPRVVKAVPIFFSVVFFMQQLAWGDQPALRQLSLSERKNQISGADQSAPLLQRAYRYIQRIPIRMKVRRLVRQLQLPVSKISMSDIEAAIVELGNMGPDAEGAIPALIERLVNIHSRQIALAADALVKIGPAAAVAVPVLEQVYYSTADHYKKESTSKALQAFNALTEERRIAMSIAVIKEDFWVPGGIKPWIQRERAAELKTIGMPAAPELMGLFLDGDSSYRARKIAGQILFEIGFTPNQDDIPDLLEVLDEHEVRASMDFGFDDIRSYAARLLGRMGPAASAALPVMEEKLVLRSCGKATEDIGEAMILIDPIRAYTALRKAWRAAVVTSDQIRPTDILAGRLYRAEKETERNRKYLSKPYNHVFKIVKDIIAHSSTSQISEVAALARTKYGYDYDISLPAIARLGSLGNAGRDELVKLLLHEDTSKRIWAVRALGNSKEAAADTVPILVKMQESREAQIDSTLRDALAVALDSIAPEAPHKAIPALGKPGYLPLQHI